MSVVAFTDEQMNKLEKNQYVKAVTKRRITYTDDFKRLFVERYRMGDMPRDIFRDAGFDIKTLGYKRIERASDRWRKKNNEGGFGDEIDYVEVHSARERHRNTTAQKVLDQRLEIERLIEENRRLREQLDSIQAHNQ